MKSALLPLALLLVTGIAAPAPASAQTSASSRESVTLDAELTHSIDARKAKVGSPVRARCTSDFVGRGGARIPKNAKLIGHVAKVQRKTRANPESTLGIEFDRALMRDGREIPLTATIQAIAPPAIMADEFDESTFGSAPGPGSISRTPGAISGLNTHFHGISAAGTPTNSRFTADATGVFGLKGLELDTTPSSSSSGSVIRSSSQNVRLESGTRLILRVNPQ